MLRGPAQSLTHVFQGDDVGMLSVSHQDFNLFRGIPLDFVDDLRQIFKQAALNPLLCDSSI